MRIITLSVLRAFSQKHPDVAQSINAWSQEVSRVTWSQPSDIKARYATASILKNRRVVFNLKGNQYRLIVAIAYQQQAVYIKFIGTHAEYDQVDAETVELK